MHVKELASWFGISYEYFRKKAKEKYEELKEYCDYEKKRGKIIIKTVMQDTYLKTKEKTTYEKIKQFVKYNWALDQPESARRVAGLCERKFPNMCARETYYKYVLRARNELWGNAKFLTPGELGGCHYVFVKMFKGEDETGSDNVYVGMNREEYIKYLEIHNQYFNAEKMDIARQKQMKGEWSREQAYNYATGDDNISEKEKKKQTYLSYIHRLSAALGCDWMVSATLAKNGVYYVEEPDKDGILRYKEVNMPAGWNNNENPL